MKLLKISVLGHVQGVGFRYFAYRSANEYNITGFVCNENDGSVYIEACGEEESLDSFCSDLKTGPSRAIVSRVRITEEGECDGFGTFSMR
jgi:acylphosphatase